MGLVAHEMYHGFGLSHSAVRDSSGAAIGGNEWDPVGKGACGFGTCIPVHLPSVQKDILGWVDAAKIFTVASHGIYTITLEQLAQPQTGNYLMVKIPQGTNHYYTVEARRKVGYDSPITSAAVIIHERLPFVNNGYIEVLSPPDQEHPEFPQWPDKRWLVGDVFQNATKSVKVTVLAETATGFRIQIETQGVKIYLPLLIR